MDSAKPGRKTKGKSEQYEKDGDMSTANDDFDALNPPNVKEIPGERTGELDNGVNYHFYDSTWFIW